MKLPVHGFETLLIDMRVNLGCRNIRMPKHFLNDAQICAIPEQVRCETVPEKMRINVFLQSGASGMFFHNLPDACGC